MWHRRLGASTSSRACGTPAARLDPSRRRGTIDDKLVQRAVLMLLGPVCEHDFMDCSHGFRPGRSAHRALEALWKQGMDNQVSWVLDVDIKSFFGRS